MTRLTLYWHLRTIVKGTPDDAYTTGSGEYAPKDGHVCDAYTKTMAMDALASNDIVAHLDAIAHDPCVPMDWRFDAEDLLSEHIMERRSLCREERSSRDAETDAAILSSHGDEFNEAIRNGTLPKPSMNSGHWSTAICPSCYEQECLFDPDNPANPNHCTGCGTEIPIPTYPA